MIEAPISGEFLYKYNRSYWAGHMYDDSCQASLETNPNAELLRRSDLGRQRSFAMEVIEAVRAGQPTKPRRIFQPGETVDLSTFSPGTLLTIDKEFLRSPRQYQSMYPRFESARYYGIVAVATVAPNTYLRSLLIVRDKDLKKSRFDPADFVPEAAFLTVGNVMHHRRGRILPRRLNVIEKFTHIDVSMLGSGIPPDRGKPVRILLPGLFPI